MGIVHIHMEWDDIYIYWGYYYHHYSVCLRNFLSECVCVCVMNICDGYVYNGDNLYNNNQYHYSFSVAMIFFHSDIYILHINRYLWLEKMSTGLLVFLSWLNLQSLVAFALVKFRYPLKETSLTIQG